jgi:hypothetical protein
MPDAFITKTTADKAISEIWSAKVYESLLKNLVCANLVSREYEGEIKQKGDVVHICSIPATLAVADVSEGVAVDAVASTITETLLTIDKWKAIHVAVSHLAKVQSSIDLLSAYSSKMGYNLAKQIDSDLITELKKASATAPDHIIQGSTPSTYAFKPLDDILIAKGLLDTQDVPEEGRFMLLNPSDYNLILALSQVQSSDYILTGAPMQDGKIPPIFGFTPYKTTNMTAGQVLFAHPSAVNFAMQQGVEFNSYDMRAQGIHADRLIASCLYGSKVMDAGKRVVYLNATGS